MTEHSVDYGACFERPRLKKSPDLAPDADSINTMLADAQAESSCNQEESWRVEVDRESGVNRSSGRRSGSEAIPNQPDPVASPKRARRRKPDFKSLRDAWDAALHPVTDSQTHRELAALRPSKPEPFSPENGSIFVV